MTKTNKNKICFGTKTLSIENINDIAELNFSVDISHDESFIKKINAGNQLLNTILKEDGAVYGVTTGYGDSCGTIVPENLVSELPLHLTRFHGCGLGAYFSHQQVRAIMAVRLCSLARGYSGVSFELLERIAYLLNHNISPRIPQEGSVGASGDLTPLSYMAAVLIGEREVSYQDETRTAAEVFKQLDFPGYTLKPKEALAIMNGTAVMTALAAEAYQRTEYLCRLAARVSAMATIALKGNSFHFDEALFAAKPHPGQIQIASWIRSDLGQHEEQRNPNRLQDRYSLRCAPHIIGVIQDSLVWYRQMIENELNSSNDNPLIDVENEQVLHGGHFYGGHIACVMDTMKTQVANLADLLDRQLALLVDTKFNNGLPANLSAASAQRAMINHGFKAVQIGVSAWTAEALKNTMPASVFSRSTECHNQDKVSMGTIAARDCLRNLELTEQVFAAHLLAVAQAINIRLATHKIAASDLQPSIIKMLTSINQDFDLLVEDRPLDSTLRAFMQKIRQRQWTLYND